MTRQLNCSEPNPASSLGPCDASAGGANPVPPPTYYHSRLLSGLHPTMVRMQFQGQCSNFAKIGRGRL
ncbi:hypothetical protein ILYODFUR_022284 [Ilyodon furcidens]|uniref:Uncharacterized protein n=1 Tax=Ilyodon furcidens TaxID=33524 RepID=A0ABV0U8T1_9TELE